MHFSWSVLKTKANKSWVKVKKLLFNKFKVIILKIQSWVILSNVIRKLGTQNFLVEKLTSKKNGNKTLLILSKEGPFILQEMMIIQ